MARVDDGSCSVARDQRHMAHPGPFGAEIGCGQLDVSRHGTQYGVDFEGRECGARAPPMPATEGQPGLRIGSVLQESLRPVCLAIGEPTGRLLHQAE